jgi:hypothetical protein
MLRTLVLTPDLYPQMISSDDDCKSSNLRIDNYELLEKQGKVIFKKNGNQYILLRLGNYSTAAIVGLE